MSLIVGSKQAPHAESAIWQLLDTELVGRLTSSLEHGVSRLTVLKLHKLWRYLKEAIFGSHL